MRLAILRIMALTLWHDRAALAMSFVLPALVYLIFAGIFAGASSGDVKVQAALLDLRQDKESAVLMNQLRASPIVIETRSADTVEGLKNLVRTGAADVAVAILDNGTGFDELASGEPPPVLILYDPFREISVNLLEGVLQESYFIALPASNLRMFSNLIEEAFFEFEPEQRKVLEEELAWLADEEVDEEVDEDGAVMAELSMREPVSDNLGLPAGVTYYAGAVAMLFLMLSAVNSAISILDEKETGLFDRMTMAPGGVPAYLQGKLAFLWLEGMVAVTVIFLVAWLGFGVDLPGHFVPWLVVSTGAALCAAGLALLFVSLCRSRRQAQSLGHILVLVIAAVGGSMVPRFLMPPAVQELGWLTPILVAQDVRRRNMSRGWVLVSLCVPIFGACAYLFRVNSLSVVARRAAAA